REGVRLPALVRGPGVTRGTRSLTTHLDLPHACGGDVYAGYRRVSTYPTFPTHVGVIPPPPSPSMRTLHELPPFKDRWSYLYLEYGTLDQSAQGLAFENRLTVTGIPIHQLSLVMLGPGTTVTHAAVKALAGNNCLLAWTGQDGVKLYAHSTGGTFSARRLIRQAQLAADEKVRLAVPGRLYPKRLPRGDPAGKALEPI